MSNTNASKSTSLWHVNLQSVSYKIYLIKNSSHFLSSKCWSPLTGYFIIINNIALHLDVKLRGFDVFRKGYSQSVNGRHFADTCLIN
jgi:hypothetical protein